jgi:ribonuclease P protein component
MRLRFPRMARLFRSSEFARMRAEGTSEHGRCMVLTVLRVAPPGETRVGIITSRCVGQAVVRNRVRRRLRELVRLDRPQLAPGFWFTLVARSAASKASFEALRTEWRRLAKRAGLLVLPD